MRYGYNTDFLNEDSELRSYFLGLFVSDGWIDAQGSVRVSSSDRQIISDLATATDYINKITETRNRRYKGAPGFTGTIQYRLSYAGPIFEIMSSLSFKPEKTGNEFIPAGISGETFHHFVRGLSDGDGSFGIYKDRKCELLKWGLSCESASFLREIHSSLVELSVVAGGAVSPGDTKQQLQFGHADAVRLGKWMYQDSTIQLDRKYKIWLAGTEVYRSRRTWTLAELEMVRRGSYPPERTRHQYLMKRYHLGLGYR